MGSSYGIWNEDVYIQGNFSKYILKRSHFGFGLLYAHNSRDNIDSKYRQNIFLPSIEYGWNYNFFKHFRFILSLRFSVLSNREQFEKENLNDDYRNNYGIYLGPDFALGFQVFKAEKMSANIFAQMYIGAGKTYQSYKYYSIHHQSQSYTTEEWQEVLGGVVPISYGLTIMF